MSELDPLTGKKSRDLGRSWYRGVLIAKCDGYSLATNSIGPLWIVEVNQPNSEYHGQIFRCFDSLGPEIMIGNPGDGATDLWFHLDTLQRPDGTDITVANSVRTTDPESTF